MIKSKVQSKCSIETLFFGLNRPVFCPFRKFCVNYLGQLVPFQIYYKICNQIHNKKGQYAKPNNFAKIFFYDVLCNLGLEKLEKRLLQNYKVLLNWKYCSNKPGFLCIHACFTFLYPKDAFQQHETCKADSCRELSSVSSYTMYVGRHTSAKGGRGDPFWANFSVPPPDKTLFTSITPWQKFGALPLSLPPWPKKSIVLRRKVSAFFRKNDKLGE